MTSPPDFNVLKQRYDKLREDKVRADANLTNAIAELTKLKIECRDKWGTDDVEELQRKYDEMVAENERLTQEFSEKLDKIDADLARIKAENDGIREA